MDVINSSLSFLGFLSSSPGGRRPHPMQCWKKLHRPGGARPLRRQWCCQSNFSQLQMGRLRGPGKSLCENRSQVIEAQGWRNPSLLDKWGRWAHTVSLLPSPPQRVLEDSSAGLCKASCYWPARGRSLNPPGAG